MRASAASPRRNRVTPTGEIEALALRGAWTGNRGILHSDDGEIVRSHAHPHWLTCTLQLQGSPPQAVAAPPSHLAVLPRRGGRPLPPGTGPAPSVAARATTPTGQPGLTDSANRRPRPRRSTGGCTPSGSCAGRIGADPRRRLARAPDGAFVADRRRRPPGDRARRVPRDLDASRATTQAPAATRARYRRRSTPPASVAILRAGYPVQIDAGAWAAAHG